MQGSRARSQLEGTRFGDVRWVDETDSTNDDALALARSGAAEGVVVVADHQRAGRGRLDRTWFAPPRSSLLVSVLLRPDLRPDDAHLAATAVACAAVDACEAVAGVTPRIKWPNDLVITDEAGEQRGKVAGVLAESVVEGDRLAAVVVGIGVNVNWPAVPDDLAGIAIALNHVSGHETDREDLLVALLEHLDRWCAELDTDAGRARLVARYRQLCETLGATVRVELPGGALTGIARDLTDSGHLLVEVDGEVHEVVTGDVIRVRSG